MSSSINPSGQPNCLNPLPSQGENPQDPLAKVETLFHFAQNDGRSIEWVSQLNFEAFSERLLPLVEANTYSDTTLQAYAAVVQSQPEKILELIFKSGRTWDIDFNAGASEGCPSLLIQLFNEDLFSLLIKFFEDDARQLPNHILAHRPDTNFLVADPFQSNGARLSAPWHLLKIAMDLGMSSKAFLIALDQARQEEVGVWDDSSKFILRQLWEISDEDFSTFKMCLERYPKLSLRRGLRDFAQCPERVGLVARALKEEPDWTARASLSKMREICLDILHSWGSEKEKLKAMSTLLALRPDVLDANGEHNATIFQDIYGGFYGNHMPYLMYMICPDRYDEKESRLFGSTVWDKLRPIATALLLANDGSGNSLPEEIWTPIAVEAMRADLPESQHFPDWVISSGVKWMGAQLRHQGIRKRLNQTALLAIREFRHQQGPFNSAFNPSTTVDARGLLTDLANELNPENSEDFVDYTYELRRKIVQAVGELEVFNKRSVKKVLQDLIEAERAKAENLLV